MLRTEKTIAFDSSHNLNHDSRPEVRVFAGVVEILREEGYEKTTVAAERNVIVW